MTTVWARRPSSLWAPDTFRHIPSKAHCERLAIYVIHSPGSSRVFTALRPCDPGHHPRHHPDIAGQLVSQDRSRSSCVDGAMQWPLVALVVLAACVSAPAASRTSEAVDLPPKGAVWIERATATLQMARGETSKLNPCFDSAMPIIATEMWKTLERYANLRDRHVEVVPPRRRYGSCIVDRMEVTSAAGDLVATLGCGVLILASGIRDPYGLEVGQQGGAVLSQRRPQHLECRQDGPSKVRCQFWREDGKSLEPFWYGIAGRLDELPNVDADMVLTGDSARTFFATHILVEIVASVRCR